MSGTIKPSDSSAPFEAESLAAEMHRLRNDFPALNQRIGDYHLTYLDNAATSQKPLAVLDAVRQFYLADNANIHRGVHTLSERASAQYEAARAVVQRFLNATRADEIIFVRGVTEAVNLVAAGFGRPSVAQGDEIVITEMEHHSNLVPWQMLCEEKGAALIVIPIDDAGDVQLDQVAKRLTPRTRLVAVTHVSNVLGTCNPIAEIVALAHQRNVPVLVDGAQAAPHLNVDVQELDCDFYTFSGHKLYAPTGIGILYAKSERLAAMHPYQTGGGAIHSVSLARTRFKSAPAKFEAGTPDIAGAIGLAAAIEYVTAIGRDRIAAYETELLDYAISRLTVIPNLQIIGHPQTRVSIIPFILKGVHPHDVATILDHHGIAIRAGHHCAAPLHQRLGLTATARASLAFYNLKEEIDRLAEAIQQARTLFKE